NFSPSQFTLNMGNVAPTVSAGGPYTVNVNQSLTLQAVAADADGDPLTFSWDVNGDGTYGDATGANPTLTWSQLTALGISSGPNSFKVTVAVSDGHSHVITSFTTLLVVKVQTPPSPPVPTNGVETVDGSVPLVIDGPSFFSSPNSTLNPTTITITTR